MRFNPSNKDTVSVQIIKIAKLAVALGISMILIAVATGKGLQKEIKEKTVAFNAVSYTHLTLPTKRIV